MFYTDNGSCHLQIETDLFLIYMPFISFALLHQPELPLQSWVKGGDSKHLCLAPDLWVEASSSIINCSPAIFWSEFYHDWVLDSVERIFFSMIFLLWTVGMVDYTDWFLIAELTLRIWNKFHLAVGYNYFHSTLLDVIC